MVGIYFLFKLCSLGLIQLLLPLTFTLNFVTNYFKCIFSFTLFIFLLAIPASYVSVQKLFFEFSTFLEVHRYLSYVLLSQKNCTEVEKIDFLDQKVLYNHCLIICQLITRHYQLPIPFSLIQIVWNMKALMVLLYRCLSTVNLLFGCAFPIFYETFSCNFICNKMMN